MKLDILAIMVHPDDVELSCSGTVMKHIDLGYKVGIIDLTQGELGTRGNAQIRLAEASVAADILGVSVRDNLGMADGFFQYSKANQMDIIKKIRQYQPDIILTNAAEDRHPDHGKASRLVRDACFLAGLRKIHTEMNGIAQEEWRPRQIFSSIQDEYMQPDIVIDISPYMDRKMKSIMAFKSQFYDPNNDEPSSPISSKEFLEATKAKNRVFGRSIKVAFAEGFTAERTIGAKDLLDLI
ncbi:MAG: bacillithiol biosynthesis deacetylase BshB1 [Bacteroidia bacterium]|nr:bacillithiol biosynthesis deacetylase BshB1 [Bacteroidia bacterium]